MAEFQKTMDTDEIVKFAAKQQKDMFELYDDNQDPIEDALNRGIDLMKDDDGASGTTPVINPADVDTTDLANLASDVTGLTSEDPTSQIAQQGDEADSPSASLSFRQGQFAQDETTLEEKLQKTTSPGDPVLQASVTKGYVDPVSQEYAEVEKRMKDRQDMAGALEAKSNQRKKI